MPSWQLEHSLWQVGYSPLAGLDEAGRGALAGPVIVGVVVLPYQDSYPFKDSKKISSKTRTLLAAKVKKCALAWSLGISTAIEIDKLNVLSATHLAAKRALLKLSQKINIQGLITDYLKLSVPYPLIAPPKADMNSFQVAAASIIAKTERDKMMLNLATKYPLYNFAQHKGYGTKNHLDLLYKHGPCKLHRCSFTPISNMLGQHKLFSSS